jgi:multidrug efflux pump subunit AcrA (membrane-fusion protein)
VISGLSLQEGTVIASNSDSSGSSTGQTIAQVTTGAMQTMVVNLTEIDVVNVRIGNKATITVDAIPDKTFTGKVISIDTTGSISSGVTSYPAVIAFDSAIENIYPNMSATARIITATKADVLLVPTSAVKTQNGESTVQVLENGSPHSQIVEIGLRSNTQTEIVSGITEGQTVITSTTARNSAQSTRNQTSSPFSGFSCGSFGAGQNTIRMIR